MLNPIDTAAVITGDQVTGLFPGQIHEGVAWWIGACLVRVHQAHHIATAHGPHPAVVEFARRFQKGAMNCGHYACLVSNLGQADETALVAATLSLAVPGAYLTAEDTDTGVVVRITIRLYGPDGTRIGEDTGLGEIRALIDTDRIPIPVNEPAQGHVESRPDLANLATRREAPCD